MRYNNKRVGAMHSTLNGRIDLDMESFVVFSRKNKSTSVNPEDWETTQLNSR